jgi:hypothetical protein
MGQSKQHYTLTWQGREVGVTYCPSYSRAVEEIQGYALAHLQVESAGRAPLPFTETGYQSRFLPAFEVDSEGGPLAYVQHWLEWAAEDPDWKRSEQEGKQMTLF